LREAAIVPVKSKPKTLSFRFHTCRTASTDLFQMPPHHTYSLTLQIF
jgi:hypothetical protein